MAWIGWRSVGLIIAVGSLHAMPDPSTVNPLQKLVEVASHDLRNPLSVILVNASVLARSDPMDDVRRIKAATRILSNVGRMDRMIGDLFDFTLAKMGIPFSYRSMPLDLGDLAAKAVDDLRRNNPTRTLVLDRAGDLRGYWDPDRLLRALQTMVTTGLKFGQASEALRVSCVVGEADDVLEVTVETPTNPAYGDHLQHLFQDIEAGGEIDHDGHWIALSVLRQTITAHGGTVEFAASPADGIRFCARLPRRAADGSSAPG
jgi:K+-sensing histidine kinase KdpD